MFPITNIVHHFHPIAWVEQMKLIFGKQTGECYCNRDFTVEEFKAIFTRLRKSEKYNLNILNGNNCNISSSDKTFERLTEEINNTINKYGITQCIQKIHFLSQIYWESDRLKTGLEYASGSYYNPGGHKDAESNGNTILGDGPMYKGRGFMQLTWRNTQIKYLKYASKNSEGNLKGKTNSELELRSNNYQKYISNDLSYALDSAGWFWSDYKKAGSKYSELKGKSLNEIALHYDKYQGFISKLVNGGGNGKTERKLYYKELKRIFKVDYICTSNESRINCSCNKKHYDNAKTEHWIHQKPSQCWDASVEILKNYGVNGGSRTNCIIMANQKNKKLIPIDAQKGIDYIDSQLKLGNPIVVGLDDNLREATYNVHKATEHFFVLVASGCEEGKRFYNFFDVGSKTKEKGTDTNNKLFIDDNLLISGKSNGGTHNYTITEVRKNN